MAQTAQSKTSPSKAAAPAAPAGTPAAPAELAFSKPVVLRRKKKKRKRKKKFTRGSKDTQALSHGIVRGASALYEGGYRTFRVLDKKSNKSARKYRDGGIRDLLKNSALAADKGLSTAAKAPYKVLRQVQTKYALRQTRPFVEAVYGMAYPFNSLFR